MASHSTTRTVTFLWDPAEAARLAEDEVALLVYRSRLLGRDLRVTNFGGGNTSAKVSQPDPFDPRERSEVLWVKGSGGDLGSLTKQGLATLSLGRLRALERLYRGHEHEDEMVARLDDCIVGANRTPPSIDTPLHAFLPFRHCDHLHPDAVIALAAAEDGQRWTEEIYGDTVAWLPWLRPGFELGLRLRACVAARPKLRGIVLQSHGLFSWGETSEDCYRNSLDLIEAAATFLESKLGPEPARRAFGSVAHVALPALDRRARAVALGPAIRGIAGRDKRMVGCFRDDGPVLDFVCRAGAPELARLGTSCPDHFLRTKIRPLVLDRGPDDPVAACISRLHELANAFRADYADYYNRCRGPSSPPMRSAAPVIVLLPGVGMWSFGRTAKEARIAGEFYVNAVNVMRGAHGLSRYQALPEQEAFDIEYWLLEEAKIQRLPPEKSLSRQVAFITGAASGIGLACAERFVSEGAAVVLCDRNAEALAREGARMRHASGADNVTHVEADLRDPAQIQAAFDHAVCAFGGVDIVVNNAGLSLSKPLDETTVEDYDLMDQVMPRGSFLVSQTAARIMRQQRTGGAIVYVVSKNALVAGPDNVAYGTAKAAQLHQMRLVAAELGAHGIRVNAVNPDAVIKNSSIWAGGWAEGRAKAYGIPVERLPDYYAERTLLKTAIGPEDIAAAVFALASDLFSKTTGATVPVDGGLVAAFPR